MSSNTGCLPIVIILAIVLALATGCSVLAGNLASQSNATNALRTNGFSNIHLLNREVLFVQLRGCGKEDVAQFNYSATNAAGKQVHVSVCEGWPFKGATIRYP
jgi:hypothetical protein